jgi:lipopolysaccharide biosynthesis glycosyltransferase
MFSRINFKSITFPLLLFATFLYLLRYVSKTQILSRTPKDILRKEKVARNDDDLAQFNWTTSLDFPERLSNRAKTIHIGMIFTHIKTRSMELKVALDSLMLYRSCTVNFHFGVDAESRESVEAYFKLRNFSAIDATFYAMEINDERVKHATRSSDFRGGIAFLKIHSDQVFSPVNEMLLIDFDILVQRDICAAYSDLQQQIKEEDKMILVAGEMGGWYDRNSGAQKTIGVDLPVDYKAFWTGLNTGIMFQDLRQMRKKNWTETWLKELQSGRYSPGEYFALGEQSLMNAIAQVNPEIFGFMPYTFNFQINFGGDQHPEVDLEFALFENIVVFHGNNGRYDQYVETRSLAHVAWLLHNPMYTGTIPSFIKSGEITLENYKEKKLEIFWYVQKNIW